MSQLPPTPPDELANLVSQLQDGDAGNPDAEWQAAIALGRVRGQSAQAQAVDILIRLLAGNSAHALIRAHAAESLNALADPRALPVLRERAQTDTYRLVRSYAAAAVGNLASAQEAIEILNPIAENDDYFGVRAEAIAGMVNASMARGSVAERQQVRGELQRLRAIEAARGEADAVRVIAEIDRGLARLAGG